MNAHTKTCRGGGAELPPPADRPAAPVLSFVRAEMVRAAVEAGMPASDAYAAASNALQRFMGDVEEAVEARQRLSRVYRADNAHARAMLDALEAACRSHAAQRLLDGARCSCGFLLGHAGPCQGAF